LGGGDLEIGMDDHCLLELDEYQLIRLGGNSAGSMNEVYQFDLETGLWTLEGELIEGRQGKNLGILLIDYFVFLPILES
jgi:hypothetical protein